MTYGVHLFYSLFTFFLLWRDLFKVICSFLISLIHFVVFKSSLCILDKNITLADVSFANTFSHTVTVLLLTVFHTDSFLYKALCSVLSGFVYQKILLDLGNSF